MDPALGRLNPAHLDTCQGIVKLLSDGSHLVHTAGHADFRAMVHDLAYRRDYSGGSAESALGEILHLA